MPDFLRYAKDFYPCITILRRVFYAYPYLGFQENRTGGMVVKELDTENVHVTMGGKNVRS